MTEVLNMSAAQRVRQCVTRRDGQLFGLFEDVAIRSVFQPIYSLGECRMVGVEGLIRCNNLWGEPVAPLEILNCPGRSEEDCVFLDRLCRYLHLSNQHLHAPDADWLFLNVSARTVIAGRRYGSYFSELLQQVDFPPQRVVVEILEDCILEEAQLSAAVDYYRELGCIIAIDDFGAGNSNFNRLWEISPDIVKLDRSLIVRAGVDVRARYALPKLVELLHESGCQVLMEGIESAEEAVIAEQSGADMVQGYYFARPALTVPPAAAVLENIQRLRQQGRLSVCL